MAFLLLLISQENAYSQKNKPDSPSQQRHLKNHSPFSFGMADEKELVLKISWENHSEIVHIQYKLCGQGNTLIEAKENLLGIARNQFRELITILYQGAPRSSGAHLTYLLSAECGSPQYGHGELFGDGEFADMVNRFCSSGLRESELSYIAKVENEKKNNLPKTSGTK